MNWAPSVRTHDRRGNGPISPSDGDLSPHPAPGVPVAAGTPRPPRRFAARPQLPALLLLSAAIVVLGGVEAALLLSQPAAPWQLILFPVAAWSWFAAGAVAVLRRPGNRMGAIMIAGALAWIVAGLANAPIPALSAVGLVVATLPLALVAHLLHAFPSGRLRGTPSRAIIAGVYATALLLHAPSYLLRPDGAGQPLMVADRPDLAQLGLTVQDAVGGSLMLATAVLLALRLRASTPPQRRVLAPLALYGIAAVVLVPLLSHLAGPLGGDQLTLFTAQVLLLSLAPAAFAGAILRGGFAPTAGVRELSAWIGADGGERATLRDALADALGDPSVELVVWAGERDGWLGPDGSPAALPDPRSGRGVVPVDADGRRVGAIVYDATLIADAAPVREAAGVIALALDRERLTAELIASRESLRRSRARIAAAADDERRRIARDLHDGVQGRLVLLAMRADAATLRAELDETLAALRELVRGVLPAALLERGLGAAADDLADRMPVPTVVRAGDERFPAAVESAAWFVIAEALANAVKHARAQALEVRVEATADGLRLEVRDDGVGGASADGGGSGLRGLADRVDVLGGSLAVDSPVGGGTRIVAEIPCAS
jgi:signal transduction histidine kinase